MARGDVVIANSHFTADAIRRLFPQVAGDRVRVIRRPPAERACGSRRR
jgi:hypothetical protein